MKKLPDTEQKLKEYASTQMSAKKDGQTSIKFSHISSPIGKSKETLLLAKISYCMGKELKYQEHYKNILYKGFMKDIKALREAT